MTDPLIDLRAASRRAVAPFYLASLPIGVALFGATTATTTFMAAPEHLAGYGFGLDVTALAYVGAGDHDGHRAGRHGRTPAGPSTAC